MPALGEFMPSDLPATITAVGALLTAIFAGVIAYRNSRAAGAVREAAAVAVAEARKAAQEAVDAKGKIMLVGKDVVEVGKRIDGRLSELLELTRLNALTEGRLQGREAERAGELEKSEAAKANGDPPQ